MDEQPSVEPLMSDLPEDEEELDARRRLLIEEAGRDLPVRGATVAGALGGNPGQVAGALTGRAWLGIEEAERQEETLEEAPGNAPADLAEQRPR